MGDITCDVGPISSQANLTGQDFELLGVQVLEHWRRIDPFFEARDLVVGNGCDNASRNRERAFTEGHGQVISEQKTCWQWLDAGC